MSIIKSSLAGCFLALGTIITSSVCAYTPLNTASTTGAGPTTLSYVGQNVPCHSTFNITVNTSGAATITGATFIKEDGDSSFCPTITANMTPWTIGTATLVSGSGATGTYTAPITGVSVTVPGLHITCAQNPTDTVTLTLNDATGMASFNGTLHNGTIACGVSGTGLSTSVRAP